MVALLAIGVGGTWTIHRTVSGWSKRDVALRAALAVASGHAALVRRWRDPRLSETLADIARDERIEGVAACSPEGSLLGRTQGFPGDLSCAGRARAREATGPASEASGDARQVTVVPVSGPEGPLGSVVLVHDLAFSTKRELTAERLFLVLLGLLAFGLLPLARFVAADVTRRSTERLRTSLERGVVPAELRAALEDTRAKLEEWSDEPRSGGWTRARLRQALRTPTGQRTLVILTRRMPPGVGASDDPRAALFRCLADACSGIWATCGASPDPEDSSGRGATGDGTLRIHPSQEIASGHDRFARAGIEAPCTDPSATPPFGARDFGHFTAFNESVVSALANHLDRDDPIVLVDGHSLGLAPQQLRRRFPRAHVVALWDLPWPGSTLFESTPQGRLVVQSLLTADVLGLNSGTDREHFLAMAERSTKSVVDGKHETVLLGSRRTRLSCDAIPLEWARGPSAPSPEAARRLLSSDLGLSSEAKLCVQFDTSAGSNRWERTLLAVERLLERFPALRASFTLAILAPEPNSGERRGDGLKLVTRVNDRFGTRDHDPVLLLPLPSDFAARVPYYLAADLCWASGNGSGLDLIAREFLLSRADEQGVLVLSRFSPDAPVGCPGAVPASPFDPDQASDMLAMALRLDPQERRARLRAARRYAAEASAYRWLGSLLPGAAPVSTHSTEPEVPSVRIAAEPLEVNAGAFGPAARQY
ncbi:MAG TPA: trehalose-6-phosphate synthase [Polyangiaceae bacterium]|nr:trehalose-6-phosphate synthase [Polyangiaceae bacterium]